MFTVQGHGVHTALLTLTAAQKKLGVPVEINARHSDSILHVHSAGPLALRRLRRHDGVKVISAHVTPATFPGSVIGAEKLAHATERYMRFLFNQGDLVIAVSDTVATELREIGVTSQIKVIPNGVDATKFAGRGPTREQARESLGLPPQKTIVLAVGQLQPRKGVQTFIEAARLLPDVEFLWVGGSLFGALSADRRKLKQAMAATPPNVTFTGLVEHSEIPKLLRAADIFMFPSHQETFGLAPVEAALAGLPLVLSDLPVFSEIFASRETSYLPATSVTEYVNAITSLTASTELRETLGRRARAVGLAYDADRIARMTMTAYLEALDQLPSRQCSPRKAV
jgi:glycosyltransferase involved in cell wall biosynthesis